ncbi:hypothetical protein K443DRAFT_444956 [Laccaria amethystina LaAM-08-1]|uniref:Uncharacterized protein n=1 Tax=Laccaria amethystina LaAM-08-1 TaxID=1095629 RepID=A0A0C9WI17_9AGAR|nr:hypothetical protein K443DRAFT_444956 [Laccaria amethystina LaAM-08-1]
MKTLFPFFIALVAVIVHATPAIQNDRMEKDTAVSTCIYCGSKGVTKPFCRPCPELTLWNACMTTHGRTCGPDATDDKSCPKGSWGCRSVYCTE